MNADGIKIALPATIHELTPASAARWDAFVDSCAEATFFHRAGWKQVIERSFGHRTYYLYAERDGRIVGILPLVEVKSALFGHAIISNAFSVCGGPVAVDETARAALDARAEEIFRRSRAAYLEYRCPVRFKHGWATRNNLYAGFAGVLPDREDENLKLIPRKQRAVVRKAIDSALTWQIEDNVDNLYRLYAISVRNLGTPVFGKRYFRNLLSVFGDEAEVLTVFSEGQAVASVMTFYFKNRVLPFYTGSRPGARKLGANDLMYWRLMRHAVTKGCTIFDFGRSKVGTGPYDFKRNWGFVPEPLTHQYLTKVGVEMPDINPTNPKYKPLIAAWKKLPLPVANFIGPFIVRNIG